MLILTRRIGETLVIGENGDIKITVLGIKGNQVRIGADAPKEVPIYREEIFNRIQCEREEDWRNKQDTKDKTTERKQEKNNEKDENTDDS